MAQPAISRAELDQAYADEVKEFHFHVCFFQNQPKSVKAAEALYKKIQDMNAAGFFKCVSSEIHYQPFKPHLIGSYEVWCPTEHFARAYSWILLNRGDLTVLVHPLTRLEMKDHTERAVWLGPSLPLDFSYLVEKFDEPQFQYPELKLGYSAPAQRR